MIWIKIITAAVLSGSLFAMVETVLPPRPPLLFTIQISDWPGDQLFALIEPLGLAENRQIHFDIRRTAPSRDPVTAFRDGLVDAVLVGLDRIPELGPDEVRIIYAVDEVAGGGGLVGGPGVTTGAALRGHQIGVTFTAAAAPLTPALLQRAGVGPDEVTLVSLAPESAPAALRSGRVAAVAALSPGEVTELQQSPGATLLASTADQAGLVTHVLVVREGRIPGDRERLEAVIRTLSQVVRTCRPAMEHCLELMATASGRSAGEWRRDFEAVRLLDLADNQTLLSGGSASPIARRLSAIVPRQGQLPSSLRATGWIDPSLVTEAAQP